METSFFFKYLLYIWFPPQIGGDAVHAAVCPRGLEAA